MLIVFSSPLCLSNANGDNIDSGVPNVSEFYNLKGIGNYLSNAYKS